MLVNTSEGDTFTLKEITAWLTAAGSRMSANSMRRARHRRCWRTRRGNHGCDIKGRGTFMSFFGAPSYPVFDRGSF
jgi:hypothetical protein